MNSRKKYIRALMLAILQSTTLTLTPSAQAMQNNLPPAPPIPQRMDDRGSSNRLPGNSPHTVRVSIEGRIRRRNPIQPRLDNPHRVALEENPVNLPTHPTALATIVSPANTSGLRAATAVISRQTVTAPDVTILSGEEQIQNQHPLSTIPNATLVEAPPLEAIVVGPATRDEGYGAREEFRRTPETTSDERIAAGVLRSQLGCASTAAVSLSALLLTSAFKPLCITAGVLGSMTACNSLFLCTRCHESMPENQPSTRRIYVAPPESP